MEISGLVIKSENINSPGKEPDCHAMVIRIRIVFSDPYNIGK